MVHRPAALKVGRGGRLPGPAILIVLAILEAAWFAWFVLEPLPSVGTSAGPHGLSRVNLLVKALPEVVPGLRFRDSYLGIALGHLGHFENLPQRLPIVLAAGSIVASALALGLLALRVLRLPPRLDRIERLVLGFGLGTTGLGLATLLAGRLGLISPWAVRAGLAIPIVVEALMALLGRDRVCSKREASLQPDRRSILGFLVVAGPFLLIMTLGAMLPCVEFDALEYHLQGPKEYYLAGRISYLPHNVYTSMPSGVEMLHLLGMELVDDWWVGALVGQLVVASFAPMTAALIAMTARRLASPRAGWVAAVVYLSTPWTYRMAVLPFVEGPLCYYHAALIWAWARSTEPSPAEESPATIGPTFMGPVVGLLAGGALALKYPALVSAVIPATFWATLVAAGRRSWRPLLGYAAGAILVAAPWMIRNVLDTGNPIYPLGYALFGGPDWGPAREAQWSSVHAPRPIEALALARSVLEVAGRSDWQSPLYVALAPLAFFGRHPRRPLLVIGLLLIYLFLTWWLLTHRLDRFWLPLLPPLAILAGIGSDWSRSRLWSVLLGLVMGAGIFTNLVFCSTELSGLNDWTGDLGVLRREVPRLINPAMARVDEGLPGRARVLMVGQAAVFHFGHPALYNTVFDDDLFEGLARGKSPEQVRAALVGLGITHVYVDWSEIERYRSPGNYGFTPFVEPGVFAKLVRAGILGPSTRPGPKQELYEVRSSFGRPG